MWSSVGMQLYAEARKECWLPRIRRQEFNMGVETPFAVLCKPEKSSSCWVISAVLVLCSKSFYFQTKNRVVPFLSEKCDFKTSGFWHTFLHLLFLVKWDCGEIKTSMTDFTQKCYFHLYSFVCKFYFSLHLNNILLCMFTTFHYPFITWKTSVVRLSLDYQFPNNDAETY